jgi:tetratricopeptide (TPR) repeat protein
MTTPDALPRPPSREYHDLYAEAKAAYARGSKQDFVASLALNRQLFEQATRDGHVLWQIFGSRFMGLCHHRLAALKDAVECFERAMTLAEPFGDDARELVLLIKNHLANTLRPYGKLEEAHTLLRDSLKQATLPRYLHAHGRLVGSLGALLDQFGQRSASDDCYARFEVLSRLRDNKHRLANAVSLAARAAELRGDFTAAEEKYDEEARLAVELKDPSRMTSALLHSAWMAWQRGDHATAEGRFQDALRNLGGFDGAKRQVDALELYAKFRHAQDDLFGARQHFLRARDGTQDLERLANIDHGLARVCRDAGLYGESLFYLSRSVELRAELYAPLRQLSGLAAKRWDELKPLTDELVEDAFRVARDEAEREKLAALVDRVHGAGKWAETAADGRAKSPGKPMWEHRSWLRKRSREVWDRFLLPGSFDQFSETSRELLERAELSYSSAVDDLGRSVHLLALVMEHELRERVFEPAQRRFESVRLEKVSETHRKFSKIAEKNKHGMWGLGDMFKAIEQILTPPEGFAREDQANKLHMTLADDLPKLRRVLDARRPILDLYGGTIELVAVRNAVAHGDRLRLDRLQVDAIKRHLALEAEVGEPTILQALVSIQPCASARPS